MTTQMRSGEGAKPNNEGVGPCWMVEHLPAEYQAADTVDKPRPGLRDADYFVETGLTT